VAVLVVGHDAFAAELRQGMKYRAVVRQNSPGFTGNLKLGAGLRLEMKR
jgi:hypothetical protein